MMLNADDPAVILRAAWAETLCFAIRECDPEDAAQVMTACLQSWEAGMPEPGIFGATRGDAEWWADLAPDHELQEFAYAALRQLGQRALGQSARKRFILVLWNGLSPDDKRGFLEKVGGGR